MSNTQTQKTKTLFNFNADCAIGSWLVVNDIVMGGKSSGHISLNESGNGLFNGYISTENNGGFSSIRLDIDSFSTDTYQAIVLEIKGDGSIFQFRIKRSTSEHHSYIFNFETSGEWQTLIIPLHQMTPSFRGSKLDLSNFDKDQIEQIGFLIAPKINTSFQLEIKRIILK